MLLALEACVGEPRLYGWLQSRAAALKEIRETCLYFIMVGEAAVGTAGYRLRPDGSVYIGNLAVAPAFRRQGIGRAAMAFLLEQNKGAPRVDLVTHPENVSALALYAAFGFAVESRQENYFGDGEPRLVLAKM